MDRLIVSARQQRVVYLTFPFVLKLSAEISGQQAGLAWGIEHGA